MELASVVRSSIARASNSAPAAIAAARALEVAGQLRAAIMEGDDTRIARLMSDLLRVRGLTKGQRVRLQSRALLNLVHSLRSAVLNDDVTGLLNRRGFVQSATRVLDVALRDRHTAHLVHVRLDLSDPETAGTACAREVLLRRTGNFLRDLFPSYGVYEVLGRLGAGEFAALTPLAAHASRSAIMLRARTPETGYEAPALPLQVAVVQFDPARPAAIDELLQNAALASEAHEPVAEIASIGSAPRSDLTLA